MAEYYQGLGRRKTASARVRLYPGEEGFVVNGKPATEFFSRIEDLATCMLPLQVAERLGRYAVSVKVEGAAFLARLAPCAMASPARCWMPSQSYARCSSRPAC